MLGARWPHLFLLSLSTLVNQHILWVLLHSTGLLWNPQSSCLSLLMAGFTEVHHRWVCPNSSRWQERSDLQARNWERSASKHQVQNLLSLLQTCINVNFLLLSQFYLIFIHVYNMLGSNFPYPLFPPSNPFLFLLYVNFHSSICVCVQYFKTMSKFSSKIPIIFLWVSFSQSSDMGHLHSWEGMLPKATIICRSHVGACQVVRHAQPCLMPLGGKERSVPLVPTPCFPRENESQMA